jgi:hypothetical protein
MKIISSILLIVTILFALQACSVAGVAVAGTGAIIGTAVAVTKGAVKTTGKVAGTVV